MNAKAEITRGWDGDEVIKETVVSGADRNTLDAKASKWLRRNAPDPENIKPYWTLTLRKSEDKGPYTIVDYGSYTYFGRFTVLQGVTSPLKPAVQPRKIIMSKKKPYSRIENGKLIRKLSFEVAKGAKALVKNGAPEWYIRLHAEYTETVTRLAKLEDFLWVKDTKDSETRVSDEAKAVCPKAYKLLLKQAKAMFTYTEILKARVDLGWPKTPGVCECKKAPAIKVVTKKALAAKADAKKAK